MFMSEFEQTDQMGLSISEALSNPEKFEKDLQQKIVLFALLTAGSFVFLNMLVFRRRG